MSKHLSLSDRSLIERLLVMDYTFASIARILKDPLSLEHTPNGCQRTRIFYCDPQASWQKPHIEKNHTLIRRILPKGKSFDYLTHEDIRSICCHINSFSRELFDNKTPFQLLNSKTYEKLLVSLTLEPVPPDKVTLKPSLVKH